MKKLKRIIPLFLALLMLFSSCICDVYAMENEDLNCETNYEISSNEVRESEETEPVLEEETEPVLEEETESVLEEETEPVLEEETEPVLEEETEPVLEEETEPVLEEETEPVLEEETEPILEETKTNIVVAIDPGHDAKHAGAVANGLMEHLLTLKIAKYCKEELETYDGVEVYMTRSGDACPYPNTSTSGKCIKERAYAAARAGAKVYVSFHLNAQENGTAANGAEVIYPNNSWKAEVGNEGKKVAQSVQNKLVGLGLKDRGIYTKNSTIGERYEDGSKSDYYAVQIYNKENSIPGIIIEHAFITNKNDVKNFLSSESGLRKLAIADATGIAEYLGVCKKNESNEPEDPDEPVAPEKPVEPSKPVEPNGEVIETGYYYITSNKDKKFSLDIANESVLENANIEINEENYKLSQIFYVEYMEDGYYRIQNVKSKKYLTSQITNNGVSANVLQKDYTGASYQKWCVREDKEKLYTLVNVGTGLNLDIRYGEMKNGSNVQTYTLNGTEAQEFLFERTDWIEEGDYYIGVSKYNNFVLDVDGGLLDDRANVQIYNKAKSRSQVFSLEYEEGYYIIRNKKSGKVLDVKFGGNTSGTNVWQYGENQSDAQKWTLKKNKDESFTMVSAHSGLALDVQYAEIKPKANVQIYKSNDTIAQKFVFINVEKEETEEIIQGRFYICAKENEKYVIDIKHASIQERANVQLYEMNQTLAQVFDIVYEDGCYTIKNVKSGMALDVKFGESNPGTNVWQYSYNGSNAQKWYIEKNDDGTYTFICKENGLALDIKNASVKNESNIQVYTPNNTDAQRFILKEFEE